MILMVQVVDEPSHSQRLFSYDPASRQHKVYLHSEKQGLQERSMDRAEGADQGSRWPLQASEFRPDR
jgi:hypothetical protein